ncbi:Uu.00g027330.m01.CDS01 [Anthostomella pinea]|uniref:Uu.00g027330.m01.CDS01 n=1 Tax=Anthostomella pinea TaxID=933095 RepID=A0AAI8V7Q6_9PEZI|nr:Uu.00g027330.m01.CDS01 [Anthostomella pinea]
MKQHEGDYSLGGAGVRIEAASTTADDQTTIIRIGVTVSRLHHFSASGGARIRATCT